MIRQPPQQVDFAASLMTVADMHAPLLDSVVGYYTKTLAAGFDHPAAQVMATAYHAYLLELMACNARRDSR